MDWIRSRPERAGALALLLPSLVVLVAAVLYPAIAAEMRSGVPLVLKLLGGSLATSLVFHAARIGGRPAAAPLGALVFWLVAFAYFAGTTALALALVLPGCALAVASLAPASRALPASTAALCGLLAIGAVVGWLLPFPVHYPLAYLSAAALLVLWRARAIAGILQPACTSWRQACTAHPLLATATLCIGGFGSLGLWLPTLNYDDQAAHLLLSNQLLTRGYHSLDVLSQVWAASPWLNNALHAVAAQLGGEALRTPLNLAWLVLGAGGSYRLAVALGAGARGGLCAALVYCSHPLTAFFGSSMQVDSPSAVVILHLAALLAGGSGRQGLPPLAACGILLGALLGLKTSNVVYMLPACLHFVWLGWCHARPGWTAGVAVLAAAVGGSSYLYAWLVAGNPVFPLFNAVFHSPYFAAESFADTRWHTGVRLDALWDMTFHSSRYMEAYDGAFGLALLALSGGALLALARPGAARWIVVWMGLAGLALFAQIQYLRYIYPALVVLCTVSVAALARTRIPLPVLAGGIVALALANVHLLATTNWVMHAGAWQQQLLHGRGYSGRLVGEIAPQRLLVDRLRQQAPRACVLSAEPEMPFIGDWPGAMLSISWYDPQMQRAAGWADADTSGGLWRQVIEATGVSHLITGATPSAPLARALEDWSVVDSQGSLRLWARPDSEKGCRSGFIHSRDRAHLIFHRGDSHD